jgi:4-amino-4-deoxy-L-arabinose transferase-like glycosyltransferase
MYHLPFARAFAVTAHLPFLPALRFPVFPQLNEVLFALALLLGGDGAAQLLMVAATLLTGAFLIAWGRSAAGGRSPAGWLAAAALAGNPLVIYLAASAYVDAALALWVTAALYCLHRDRQAAHSRVDLPAAGQHDLPAADRRVDLPAADRRVDLPAADRRIDLPAAHHRVDLPAAAAEPAGSPRRSDRRAWLVLAGAFAGGAAAGKYLGLFFVLAIGAIVVWNSRRRALWFAAAAAAIMAPWYARIVHLTHNPVFPYFPQWFGSSLWDPLLFRPVLSRATLAPGAWAPALGARLLALLRLPWDLSFGWRTAGAVAPLSPAYLAAMPLLAAGWWSEVRVRRPLALAAAFAFATLLLPREPRYVVAALPLLSLATGLAIAHCLAPLARSGWPARRGLVTLLCAGLLLPGWLYGLDRLRRLGLPPASAESREAILAHQLPLYPALRFLNRTRGSAYTAYGWQTENLQYFAAGHLLGDWTGPASYARLPAVGGDPEALAQALRRLGAGYLILPARAATAGGAGAAAFRRRFELLFADANGRVFAVTAAAGGAGARP